MRAKNEFVNKTLFANDLSLVNSALFNQARQGAQNHIQGATTEMFQVFIVGRRCDFDTGIRTIDTEFEYGFKCIERMCGSVQQKNRSGLCFLQPFSPAPF